MRTPLFLLLAACATDPAGSKPGTEPGEPHDSGQGDSGSSACLTDGRASARQLEATDLSEGGTYQPGGEAIGTSGDWVIENELASFVITDIGPQRTYYYYPGVIADAAPREGCNFAGEDKLDEVAPILGSLNLADFATSTLRGFRGTSVEVINDGRDGNAAILRVHGTDDTHWLVEYELIRQKVSDGGRPVSAPYGLELQIDHILEPGSRVLRSEWTFRNVGEDNLSLLSGHLLSFGPSLDLVRHAETSLSVGGFTIAAGIPYLVAGDGAGAYAFTVEQGNLAYIPISGIDVALDLNQATSEPIRIGPGESATRTTLLAVSPTGGTEATEALLSVNPELIPGKTASPGRVTGRVQDTSGEPVVGARVEVQTETSVGTQVMDFTWTDASGNYTVSLPQFADPWAYSLVVSDPGREPQGMEAPTAGSLDVVMAPRTELVVDVREGEDFSPARISLIREDGLRETFWTDGDDSFPLRPGVWQATISRGYEYNIEELEFSLPEGGSIVLAGRLEHLIDTTGWMSADTHVHSEHSPDSRMRASDQLLHAAAHGLEVVVHTEHEHLVDAYAGLVPELRGHVASVIGQEVTATMPEHMTLLPIVPDGTERGGYVEWYGLDLAGLFSAMRDRSPDGVNIFNHPSYMWMVDWDVVAAEPRMDDPTVLGLSPDQAVWSWDFEGMEVMNGLGSPFYDGNGRYHLWWSALNTGHRITAVASSDDHGGWETGFPRSYFPVADDAPASFADQDLVDGVRNGAIILSGGAFARISVDGAGPGELATLTEETGTLNLEIQSIPQIDVDSAILLYNCERIRYFSPTDAEGIVKFQIEESLSLTEDGALVLVAFGDAPLPEGFPASSPHTPRVLTNPIFVDADGDGNWTPPGGRECAEDFGAP